MRVNNYESKQNFGMAFRFKFKADMAEVSEKYYKYAIKDNATLRGHKQLCKEQKRLNRLIKMKVNTKKERRKRFTRNSRV